MEDVNAYSCQAVEDDWLDISYTERKYVNKEPYLKTGKKSKVIPFLKQNFKYVLTVALLIVAVCAMMFATNEESIFKTARLAYTTTFLSFYENFGKNEHEVVLPPSAEIDNVAEDGKITITGGRFVFCLQKGKVTEITEDSVTIEIDEKTTMVYCDLTEILVEQDSEIALYQCIGEYEGTMSVQVIYNGQAVTDVVGNENSFKWEG